MKPNNRKNKGTAKGCKGEEVEKKDKGDNEKCEKWKPGIERRKEKNKSWKKLIRKKIKLLVSFYQYNCLCGALYYIF